MFLNERYGREVSGKWNEGSLYVYYPLAAFKWTTLPPKKFFSYLIILGASSLKWIKRSDYFSILCLWPRVTSIKCPPVSPKMVMSEMMSWPFLPVFYNWIPHGSIVLQSLFFAPLPDTLKIKKTASNWLNVATEAGCFGSHEALPCVSEWEGEAELNLLPRMVLL